MNFKVISKLWGFEQVTTSVTFQTVILHYILLRSRSLVNCVILENVLWRSGSSVNRGLSNNICEASDHVVQKVRLGILSRISVNTLVFRFLSDFDSSWIKEKELNEEKNAPVLYQTQLKLFKTRCVWMTQIPPLRGEYCLLSNLKKNNFHFNSYFIISLYVVYYFIGV